MILNRQRRIPVAIQPLTRFFERAQSELRFPENAVTVRLVSDVAMARLNRDFRGKRGPTDVLSFPVRSAHANGASLRPRRKRELERGRGKAAADGLQYVGDIAISPETARRNARRFERTLSEELRILILHGMIHLAGYDHENDNGQMERIERRLRRRLGLQR